LSSCSLTDGSSAISSSKAMANVDNWQFELRDSKWVDDFFVIDITITNLGPRRNFGYGNLMNPGPELVVRDSTNKITEPWVATADPRKGEMFYLPVYFKEFYPNDSWSGNIKFKMNPNAKDIALLLTYHYHSEQYLLFNLTTSTGSASNLPPPSAPPVTPPPSIPPKAVNPAVTNYIEVSLTTIANFSSSISNPPNGDQVFLNVPFKISGKELFLSQYGEASLPQEAILETDISKAKTIFILINTTATYPQFMNKQAGKITLIFDTGQTEETNLIVGKNIREYAIDELYGPTVRTVSDSNNQVAWQGNSQSRLIAIDMLTIPISSMNQARVLKQIKITDTSAFTTNSADPGLLIWGLTVEKVD
jgi:hypothetical protein